MGLGKAAVLIQVTLGDKTRDGDATANRDHSRDQESRDAMLARTITEAVAQQTQSIAEMFTQQNNLCSCLTNYP